MSISQLIAYFNEERSGVLKCSKMTCDRHTMPAYPWVCLRPTAVQTKKSSKRCGQRSTDYALVRSQGSILTKLSQSRDHWPVGRNDRIYIQVKNMSLTLINKIYNYIKMFSIQGSRVRITPLMVIPSALTLKLKSKHAQFLLQIMISHNNDKWPITSN